MHRTYPLTTALLCFFSGSIVCADTAPPDKGIPVDNALVIEKCGSCHTRDSQGNMQRISWERSTPEGWQAALKRMVLIDGLSLTPNEARAIVKYLSSAHGLAPEEAKAVLYDAERRVHQETEIPDDRLQHACARCHTFAGSLSWRRSPGDWQQLIDWHSTQLKLPPNAEALAFITKAAPLHTPEWDAWSVKPHSQNVAGRWLVTATLRGRGKYYGELQVDASGDDEFTTTVRLTSLTDGSQIVRSGRGVLYAGYAWRGRSKGTAVDSSTPDDPSGDAREVLWFAPDQATGEGRWFWGQYQEFGFDVTLRRPSQNATILLADPPSFKIGSEDNRLRLLGDRLPVGITATDLQLGPGVTVKRILSSSPSVISAEIAIAPDAAPGKRDIAVRGVALPNALALYDRIDYVKVAPDSAMAAFADGTHARGYQQFEVIGYQRGADGRLHTADDIELGPLNSNDVDWSLDVFYAKPGGGADFVGKISASGFFTPSPDNPKANFDVWVVATLKNEKALNGKPLVGKSYMVVTVPMYTLNGRQYVRDLDRWVDNGPAQ